MSGSSDASSGNPSDLGPASTPAEGAANAAAPTPVPADNQAPANQTTTTTGDNNASTPDAPVSERDGLLAAVRKVLDPTKGKTPQQGEPGTPTQSEVANPVPAPQLNADGSPKTPAQLAAEALAADPSADEIKAMAPRTKARVEQLLAQRAAFRTEVETLKPDAAKWQQMNAYLEQHKLAPADVNLLLGVGATLRRGDFQGFLNGIMPYVRTAQEAVGQALPADMQAKVDAGEMSEEAARQLSTTRFQNARLQSQAREATAATEQLRATQEADHVAQVVRTSIDTWEADIRKRDPDYALKAPAVMRTSQALIAQHGRPATAEQAMALANRAYEEVNRLFAAALPARRPTIPVPSGARTVNGARAAPNSLMEAAMQGLERGRRH